MKQVSALLMLLIIVIAGKAQSVVTIQRGTSTFVYSVLDSALAHAQSGDAIYLPGGVVPSSTGINVTTKVYIFGAGYRGDTSVATGATNLFANVTFSPGAEGSSITGVSMQHGSINTLTINCNNVYVTRCLITQLILNNSGALIEENIINGYIASAVYNTQLYNVMIRKNVVYSTPSQFDGVSFYNNVFLDDNNANNNTELSYMSNCTFYNNIFLSNNALSGGQSNCQFSYNLFTYVTGANSVAGNTGNIDNVTLASIFKTYNDGSPWNLAQNFKLQTGCPGIKAGSDGTDMGVYGTATPFKNSTLPYNPHIQSVSIPTTTDQNGKLNVSITVAAQNQ